MISFTYSSLLGIAVVNVQLFTWLFSCRRCHSSPHVLVSNLENLWTCSESISPLLPGKTVSRWMNWRLQLNLNLWCLILLGLFFFFEEQHIIYLFSKFCSIVQDSGECTKFKFVILLSMSKSCIISDRLINASKDRFNTEPKIKDIRGL